MSGAGAAGTAILRVLLAAGVRRRRGRRRRGRSSTAAAPGLHESLRWLAEATNEAELTGGLKDALVGADVFIGVSAPNILTGEDVARDGRRRIVFALANPVPEIDPAEAREHAAVVATGRSDYPNQINNVLAFPGVFRGLLDASATPGRRRPARRGGGRDRVGGHRRRAERQLHHPERLPRRRAHLRGRRRPGTPRRRHAPGEGDA